MTPIICTKCGATLNAVETVCSQCGTAHSVPTSAATIDLPDSALTVSLIPPVSGGDTLPLRIGRYDIREKVGEGSFGIVYRAWDPHLKRDVALKVAKPAQLSTPEKKQRFLREAQSAAKLRHSNIVEVFEAGEDGAYSFIAQWFINGPSLDRMLDEQPDRRLSSVQSVGMIRTLASALASAHDRGIVHRDVKPANVLLESSESKTDEPILTDFGLAAFSEESAEKLTQDATRIMGTPAYMAPEQARGYASAASDQYSLGCTFYELLTGETPFGGPPAVQIANHLSPPIRHTDCRQHTC